MERIPIIVDTDPGMDIDDALALAYLAREPRCELLGITVVSGAVEKRAAIAEIVLRAAGREDVPIHLGARDPIEGPGQPDAPQYDAVAHLPHRMDRPEETAGEFLNRTIIERPGEITLLTIGPLTNIGRLVQKASPVFDHVREIVSMAGRFFGGDHQEWNVRCDVGATRSFARVSATPQRFFGLDVTLECSLGAEEFRRRYADHPEILAMAEIFLQHNERVVFHDPLAAVAIFHPDLCEYRTGLWTVDERGETRLAEGSGVQRVASDVDAEELFNVYFSALNRN